MWILLKLVSCFVAATIASGSEFEELRFKHKIFNSWKSWTNKTPGSGSTTPAPPCDESRCHSLPNCFCSGTKIPGDLKPAVTPQMIVLTFQNAVNQLNFDLYNKLFRGRVNPNGCPAVGSFFVSHQWTNYFQVQSLAAQGHEIGTNAVDEKAPASLLEWINEFGSEIRILRNLANISRVSGMRVPRLEMGGDIQFTAIQYLKLSYDATRTSSHFNIQPNLLWPYTYDYASTQDCDIGKRPISSFPGIWQLPLLDFIDRNGAPCATLEGCSVTDEGEAYNLLLTKFIGAYTSNRAPMMVAMGTQWLLSDFKFNATLRFLNDISKLKDVYYVTGSQVIDWIRQPTPLSQITGFKPWSCSQPAPPVCKTPNACHYYGNRTATPPTAYDWKYNMPTCFPCPRCYPAVNDPAGMFC